LAVDSATTPFRVAGTGGAGLRLRAAPGLQAPIVGQLVEGAVVTLSAGAATEVDGERWLPVRSGQAQGWVAARYLVRVVPLSPAPRTLPATSDFGDRVAAVASAAVGQPYVWGGRAPGGFDCSGFVQWVYGQVGLHLPRTIASQLALGRPVDRSALEAGDTVSFRNTYHPGLSHVGIYLGNDRFAHAADEARGVTVSSLLDRYWEQRFHMAVRLRS
jgi:cell wall-associated NlpC family hydrolase